MKLGCLAGHVARVGQHGQAEVVEAVVGNNLGLTEPNWVCLAWPQDCSILQSYQARWSIVAIGPSWW